MKYQCPNCAGKLELDTEATYWTGGEIWFCPNCEDSWEEEDLSELDDNEDDIEEAKGDEEYHRRKDEGEL